jgi:hypothetical protein
MKSSTADKEGRMKVVCSIMNYWYSHGDSEEPQINQKNQSSYQDSNHAHV